MRKVLAGAQDSVISRLTRYDDRGIDTLEIELLLNAKPETLTYRCAQAGFSDGADAALAAALLPAMMYGGTLRSPWPVSPRLYRAIPMLQDVFSSWDPRFRKITLDIPTRESSREAHSTGVAAFFSGGVDSFYTALKHIDEITALILIHGFDLRLEDVRLRSAVAASLRKAAERLGKPLIEVETNLRWSFSEHHVNWNFYHGAALASVAALLGAHLHKIYVPSSYSYAQLYPWGSHPLTDPMWSTDALEIVHDGSEVGRLEKIRRIASNPIVLDHLRVCYENTNGEYNCGRCGKCLRAMVGLHIVGALDRCATLPHTLDLKAVARLYVRERMPFLEESIQAAEEQGNLQLARALRDSLNNRYYRGFWAAWNAVRVAGRDPRAAAWKLIRRVVPASWKAQGRRALQKLVDPRPTQTGPFA